MRAFEFERVETKRKYVAVAEQILRAIKHGVYKVGDKLPPERDLADQMGVSRNSVREALSALQVLGVVQSRTGDGTYVAKAVERLDLEAQVLSLLEASESPFAIFEARAALELGVAQLAALRATPDALRRLETALDALTQSAAARDVRAYARANLAFHLALAAATGNPVVERMMRQLWETTEQGLLNEMVADYWRSAWAQSLEDHKRILKALKARDPDGAAAAVRAHYEHAYRHFVRRKEVVVPGAGASQTRAEEAS